MIETILRKIPLEMMERIRRRRGGTVETVDFGSDPPTEKTLIKLHRQVIKALQTHHRTDTLWNDWTNKVFELEDVNRNMVRGLKMILPLSFRFSLSVVVILPSIPKKSLKILLFLLEIEPRVWLKGTLPLKLFSPHSVAIKSFIG